MCLCALDGTFLQGKEFAFRNSSWHSRVGWGRFLWGTAASEVKAGVNISLGRDMKGLLKGIVGGLSWHILVFGVGVKQEGHKC